MTEQEQEQWKLAALLKDRTRREIRSRIRAGERARLVAEDFGVPVRFVEVVASWQMFEDEPDTRDTALRALVQQWREAGVAKNSDSASIVQMVEGDTLLHCADALATLLGDTK